ncbi:aminomethyl-transferring glycine dehydrogenase subunit GcvPA [Clostridia bacterium]|nr:aminomethyl-transferring glycine dehydrogenase subunit GcvPA [Clostridia bacterium]
MNYLPATEEDKKKMLERIGLDSVDDLFKDIPDNVKLNRPLNLPEGMSEYELKKKIKSMSSQNQNMDQVISFLGGGAYDHYMPALVDHLLSRSEWYTAYTPYQPEISQGTLQSIFEFQTMVCELFSMDVSNASVYDGANALCEAMIMACDRKKEIILSEAIHPEYIETVETYANGLGIEVKKAGLAGTITSMDELKASINDKTGAVAVQYPNFFGNIEDLKAVADLAHEHKAMFIVVVGDIVSMGMLEAPGNLGADIVVGEGMSLAGPINFSGPSIGLIATTKKNVRKLPGRIVGLTEDKDGKRAFVLTLQAREQHIRREKASSNICSNQALHALATNITLSALGTKGLKEMALKSMRNASYAMKRFTAIEGVELVNKGHFFNEFALKLPVPAKLLNKRLLKKGIFGCVDLSRFYPERVNEGLFFLSEFRTKEEIDLAAQYMEVIFNEQLFK